MFFSKFFSKSPEQLVEKGDLLFKNDHFSDARHLYGEALEKIDNNEFEHHKIVHIKNMISKCNNRLAEMNIAEAEAAIRSGNSKKSIEYLNLAIEQADDVHVREMADKLLKSFSDSSVSEPIATRSAHGHNCNSCSTTHHQTPESADVINSHLQGDDQFHILVSALPEDLPQRYLSLGEEFASAYLLAHTDNNEQALNKFRELLTSGENDILLYETALLEYKFGRVDSCKLLLERALALNPINPVCNLSLVQLLIEAGRYDSAIPLLVYMMDHNILYGQALIILSDVYAAQGNTEKSIHLLSGALQDPSLKKASAERLVAILNEQGRNDEAQYLFKTYLKGCC